MADGKVGVVVGDVVMDGTGQQMAPPVPGADSMLVGVSDSSSLAVPFVPVTGGSAALVLLATAAGESHLPSTDKTVRKCTFGECPAPTRGERFVKIDRGNKAGNQDWSSLADQVLCGTCYDRFKSTGSLAMMAQNPQQHEHQHQHQHQPMLGDGRIVLEGGIKEVSHMMPHAQQQQQQQQLHVAGLGQQQQQQQQQPVVHATVAAPITADAVPVVVGGLAGGAQQIQGGIAQGAPLGNAQAVGTAASQTGKKCTYAQCDNPATGTRYIKVDKSSKAGGRDWSPLDGNLLCRACYNRFRDRGTLERSTPFREPLPESERKCTYAECDNPTKGNKFIKIAPGYEAGGRDWSSLVDTVLCKACYDRYFKRGTLERSASRVAKDGSAKRSPLDPPRPGSPPRPRTATSVTMAGSKDGMGGEEGTKTCTYHLCSNPSTSSRFVKIEDGCKAGGRDWSALAGSILCHSCYNRFSYSGTLERCRKRALDDGARKCTYDKCPNPTKSSQFHQINEGCKAGNRDWTPVTGEVLCNACYSQFRHRGTLERSAATKEPLAQGTRKCTYHDCDNPTSSTRFIQIEEGCQAGTRDWSELVGEVLCHTCYGRFRDRGTLVRSRACRTKPLEPGIRKCTYPDCLKPTQSSNFYQIDEGSRAGNRDWSALAGQVLCDACYNQFRKRGSLVRCANPAELGCKTPVAAAGTKRKESEDSTVDMGGANKVQNTGAGAALPSKKRPFEEGGDIVMQPAPPLAQGDALVESFVDTAGGGNVSASAVVPDK